MNFITPKFQRVILFSSLAATAAMLSSCVVDSENRPEHRRKIVYQPDVLNALPDNYTGPYYVYDGRYYIGGRHEVGRFYWNRRRYDHRYCFMGRYYYGGQYHRGEMPCSHEVAVREVTVDRNGFHK